MNPEIKRYAERLLVFADPIQMIAKTISSGISAPLDCERSVPARPTRKNSTERTLDSNACRKLYAEMIAITGQIISTGATEPPRTRNPFRTRLGLIRMHRRITAQSKSDISLR
jgi:hypothetical protein